MRNCLRRRLRRRRLWRRMSVSYTHLGPETPLAAGIVDQFRAKGLRIVGPTAAAARLESSKTFAKELMLRAGIPTARFAAVTSAEEARDALLEFDLPVVIKADGLAAGKGVIIAHTHEEAQQAIDQLWDCLLYTSRCV